ncbi:MAG: TatD family deoxyribonuclease [Cytophagales bacterium]|nr:MAG: TatD family deoxyribonuclease [Cytophagales bacterium]TAF59228.1 MAG: TatD family deoxyribonuclease [Cytophagales bacterium]
MLVDTHAHIYLDKFKKDIQETVARAEEAGLSQIYLPNIDHTTIDDMLELEQRFPSMCIPMIGLHPCYVSKNPNQDLYEIESWLGRRKWVAVGEMGIDLYWDKTTLPQQAEAFEVQIRLAYQHQLPVVLHTREATQYTIDLLKKIGLRGLKGVFHCFGGTVAEAEQIIELGFFMGIGGVLSYPKSGLAQMLEKVALDHLVLETDSPYLTPTAYRGKRNEPAFMRVVAEQLATIKGISLEELAAKTSLNAQTLFARP